jgi:hypothetical protein
VNTQGGGILLLGATQTLVTYNFVAGNKGKQINSGGIVVLSAQALSPREQSQLRHDRPQHRLPEPARGPSLGRHRNRRAVQGQPLPDVGPGGTLSLMSVATSAPGNRPVGR